MATGIAPPREHLELGDRVRFHHRAAVARLPDKLPPDPLFGADRTMYAWDVVAKEGGRPERAFEETHWLQRMPRNSRVNKTIICWPDEGEGVIVGMIRRGIGRSVRGYESGYEYPEWNPGYFDAREWHWLYVVKAGLTQRDPFYVPLWACTLIAD
jgi:hypothetical protein